MAESNWTVVGKSGKPEKESDRRSEIAMKVKRTSAISDSLKETFVEYKKIDVLDKEGKPSVITGTVVRFQDKTKMVYGKQGSIFCIICKSYSRDHTGEECPGRYCKRCRAYGHFAANCVPKCGFCQSVEHKTHECVKNHRFKTYSFADSVKASGSSKRDSDGTEGATSEPRSKQSRPIIGAVSSFLDEVSGLMDQETYDRRSKALKLRRAEVRRRYELDILECDKAQESLDTEFSNASAYQEALKNLREITNKLVAAQSAKSASLEESDMTPGRAPETVTVAEGHGMEAELMSSPS